VTTTYDDAGRRLSVSNRGLAGALISSYGYVYDANGNRTEQTEEQAGFATASQQTRTDYTYDLTDRMTSTLLTELDTGDTLETQYTYYPSFDRKTELVTRTVGGSATVEEDRSYTYDETHWLDEIADAASGDTIAYLYDNNGNTLQKTDNTLATPEETHFVYDSRNQLVQTTRGPPASQVIQGRYDYDASGMRIRHLDSDRGNIESICDGPAILDERDASSGTLLAHYNYADRLLSLKTPTNTQYYHFAALDTTANLSDASGNVQVSYRTDAFGEITEQEGSSVNRQVFTGQEHDPNTGLIYFGARFYDPDSARFISQDSYLGEPGTPASLHRYLYAYSNPTVYVDLYGYNNDTEAPATSEPSTSEAENPGLSSGGPASDAAAESGEANSGSAAESLTSEDREGANGGSAPSTPEQKASEGHKSRPLPNFDDMEDQEIIDWVVEHREELGIPLKDGVHVSASEYYAKMDPEKKTGVSLCKEACDTDSYTLQGEYLDEARTGIVGLEYIRVYQHPMRHGVGAVFLSDPPTPDGMETVKMQAFREPLSRVESIILVVGHEGAHSVGIDVGETVGQTHGEAERIGLDAVYKFRELYK
jgi:RHS repeat-associated protein